MRSRATRDRAPALALLRQASGLGELVKMLVGGTNECAIRLLHIANAVKVTPTQFPRVKHMVDRVVDVLDFPSTPEVFVVNNPFFSAGAYGVKEPFVVLKTAKLACDTLGKAAEGLRDALKDIFGNE